jgi:hypothetical protein
MMVLGAIEGFGECEGVGGETMVATLNLWSCLIAYHE